MKLLLTSLLMTLTTLTYASGVMVHDAYVRLLPPTAETTGAFMMLMNHSDVDASLVKAESDVAKKVEIHNHVSENGMMKMREVDKIDIKANESVELKPGSFHIMLIGLKAPLKKDQQIKLKLHFADKTVIDVTAPVKEMQEHSGHHHH